MITLLSTCLIMGCVDIPLVVSKDPVSSYLEHVTKPRKKVDKVNLACYIDGVFYPSCP